MTTIEERNKVIKAVNGITLTKVWDEIRSGHYPDADSVEKIHCYDIENIRFKMAGGDHGTYFIHEEELNERVIAHWEGYLENNGYKKIVATSWIKEGKVYA